MKRTIEQLGSALRRIRLSDEERSRMKQVLHTYIEHKPLVHERSVPIARQWFVVHRFAAYVAAVMVLVVISTSVAYAAEGTVPGDALYAIKVAVTEPIRAAFTNTPEERAAWEVARAERRLAEAETLAYEGRLTAEHRTRIESHLETHLEEARKQASEREEILADIEETMEAILEVHEGILASLEEQDGEEVKELLALVQKRGEEHRVARNTLTRATRGEGLEETAMLMAVPAADADDALSTEEATTTEEMVQKEEVTDLAPQLERAQKRFDAVVEEAEVQLPTFPESTKETLERLLKEAEEAFEDAEDAYTESRREDTEEAIGEALRSTRRIEAALRATDHVRRLDPGLWPIYIAPREIDEAIPVLDDGRDGDVRGEFRKRIEDEETKIDIRVR